jgi:hypothetical protein
MFYVVVRAILPDGAQEREEERVRARFVDAVPIMQTLYAVIDGEWTGRADRDPEDRATEVRFWITRVDEATPVVRGGYVIGDDRADLQGLEAYLRSALTPIW